METVLIKVKKKSDIIFLLELAEKLGMSAKALSKTEIGDWQLAQKIEDGMKSPSVSRESIMKSLKNED